MFGCYCYWHVGPYFSLCSLLQNPPRKQKSRRTSMRRVLNSVREKTELTTTTHQKLLNYPRWSTMVPMGRAPGASAPHELLNWSQNRKEMWTLFQGIDLGRSTGVWWNPAICSHVHWKLLRYNMFTSKNNPVFFISKSTSSEKWGEFKPTSSSMSAA